MNKCSEDAQHGKELELYPGEYEDLEVLRTSVHHKLLEIGKKLEDILSLANKGGDASE